MVHLTLIWDIERIWRMDKEEQEVPSVTNQSEVKISNNLSFAKALAYGFVISSVGILIAVIGFLLTSR